MGPNEHHCEREQDWGIQKEKNERTGRDVSRIEDEIRRLHETNTQKEIALKALTTAIDMVNSAIDSNNNEIAAKVENIRIAIENRISETSGRIISKDDIIRLIQEHTKACSEAHMSKDEIKDYTKNYYQMQSESERKQLRRLIKVGVSSGIGVATLIMVILKIIPLSAVLRAVGHFFGAGGP